jgi:2,3-bisphosphoglycerate-independent phosphoglycerate mutase
LTRILFLFLDGVGLGDDDPVSNPFAAIDLPTLVRYTNGQTWLRGLPRIDTQDGVFIPTDACLGVDGNPQSATGQAAIMTGVNIPREIGYHYGPKPNPEVAAIIQRESVVTKLTQSGLKSYLVNAYPSTFLNSIKQGKRLRSANQLALDVGGVQMLDELALVEGRAMAADLTGELWRQFMAYDDAAAKVWRTRVGDVDAPLYTPFGAGRHLAGLAKVYEFTFFDHWLTDYVGHRQNRQQAIELLKRLDGVLSGILSNWDTVEDLIVVTSDHGNLEDLSSRGHTRNPVPTLVIGEKRHKFAQSLSDLTGFAPAILRTLLPA